MTSEEEESFPVVVTATASITKICMKKILIWKHPHEKKLISLRNKSSRLGPERKES